MDEKLSIINDIRDYLPCPTHNVDDSDCVLCGYEQYNINYYVEDGEIYFRGNEKLKPFIELHYIAKSVAKKAKIVKYKKANDMLFDSGNSQAFAKIDNDNLIYRLRNCEETKLIPCFRKEIEYRPPTSVEYDLHCTITGNHFSGQRVINKHSTFYIGKKGVLIQIYFVNKIPYFTMIAPRVHEFNEDCTIKENQKVLNALRLVERYGKHVSKVKASSRVGVPISIDELQYMNQIIDEEKTRRNQK